MASNGDRIEMASTGTDVHWEAGPWYHPRGVSEDTL